MKHVFTVTIDTPDGALAGQVRDEAVGAIEDFIESRRPGFDVDCGVLLPVGAEQHKAFSDEAHELYAAGSDDDVVIPSDAVVDIVREDGRVKGAWIDALVWVSASELPDPGAVSE